MKKLFALLLLMLSMSAFAFEIDNQKEGKYETVISQVGFRILNANRLPHRVVFRYKTDKDDAAIKTRFRDRSVVVTKGFLACLEDEDELAAMLAQQIALAQSSSNGLFRGYFFQMTYDMFTPRKYNYLADKRAVDYLVNAGYHPVALIVALNKIYPQTRYDWYTYLPLTTKRLMRVYEYIYTKYPEYLAKNKYLNNPYYQNFLLISAKDREKFKKKAK